MNARTGRLSRPKRRPRLYRLVALAGSLVLVAGGVGEAAWSSSSTGAKNAVIVPADDPTFQVPPGNNAVYIPSGTHTVIASSGNNDIYPGIGSHDDIIGGSGITAVVYAGRTAPISVTLDNKANDGQAGEDDNIHSNVQEIYGGNGGDHLIGDLQPGAPSETIVGGSGNNYIVGGSGSNYIYAGPGTNVVDSFNGKPDTVDCAGGNTTVEADASDLLINCRHRKTPPRITSPIGFTFFFGPTSTRVGELTVSSIPSGGTVEVTCGGGGGCPFLTDHPKLRANQHHVALAALFHGASLRVGTQIEVRITKPNIVLQNAIGKVDLLTIKAGAPPAVTKLCLPPGSSTPKQSC
jgi:Ca2+-binding RTX toxin-like protein